MIDLRFLDPNGLVNRESFNERFGLLNNLMNHIGNEYVWEKRDTANQLVGYVNSSDPNAYPTAVDDGCTYNLLGRLGEKTRIETGSYAGTGTYGAANKCNLTFGFIPKLVVIVKNGDNIGMIAVNGCNNALGLGGMYSTTLYATWSEKTLSWYANTASNQLNESNTTQYYVAIG